MAEGYAKHINVSDKTPLIGWSMTKSIWSLLAAMRVSDKVNNFNWETAVDLKDDGVDEEDVITAHNLVNMDDGLEFLEVTTFGIIILNRKIHFFAVQIYGIAQPPSQMLHIEPSAAAYVKKSPMVYKPGHRWCYHSGATNVR